MYRAARGPNLRRAARRSAGRDRRVHARPATRDRLASSPVHTLLRTPLHDRHVALGAKLVPFGGWEMPLSYGSVLDEHRACRTDAVVFDVSHLGTVRVEGPDALDVL